MIAELRFDGAVNGVKRGAKDHLIELFDHFAWPELTQVAALSTRGTGRMLPGNFFEIATG